MRISKLIKREAKQLFRFCLINGLLDENRVRRVGERYSRRWPSRWGPFFSRTLCVW